MPIEKKVSAKINLYIPEILLCYTTHWSVNKNANENIQYIYYYKRVMHAIYIVYNRKDFYFLTSHKQIELDEYLLLKTVRRQWPITVCVLNARVVSLIL